MRVWLTSGRRLPAWERQLMPDRPSFADIFRARRTIAPLVRQTPLLPCRPLEERLGVPVYLKAETLQETGSFKVRGAANKILNLDEEARQRGVVTASTGNHGRAVAYVAGQAGIPAVVCLSERVPADKVEALHKLGAELVIEGEGQDEAVAQAEALCQSRGLSLVHPFDDPLVIAGQGTIGLELLAALSRPGTVLVPLSGGGLISGIALALKSVAPQTRVIGVSMERSAVMYESLAAGEPVVLPEEETLADSLLGGIGLDNRYTLRLVQEYVDEVILVSEAAIAAAMRFLLEEAHLVAEGAGAVGVAALLSDRLAPAGENMTVIISGGNLSPSSLLRAIAQ